ncbi:MAG TPA: NAD(P)/FAD-dependent oxidoreductase [Cyclobacteriaceae bacterium]|nr:NAD(P)/FAD-dependent oxidoreductase [Cyclobacteriaceae bacterium]
MSQKKVIIIGGGMAGLCAGTYLRMNGYDTTIFEMNATPGGLCTSWKRGDYTVDLCIHWLVGSGPSSSFYGRWNELIRMDEIQFVDPDEFFRAEDGQGKCIRVFTDLDKLEHEFLANAPEDEILIRKFIKDVKKFVSFDALPENASEIANVWEKMKMAWKMLPYIRTFSNNIKHTCRSYSRKFKNPLLQKTIAHLFDPDMSIVFGMIALTWFHKKSAGYPIGGSLNFGMKMYDRYNELGGSLRLETKVTRILTENDQAVGVELSNGEKYKADYVISAADGYTTIFEMLKGWYTDETLLNFYKKSKTFPSLVFVALGIRKDFKGFPRMVVFPASRPVYVDPTSTMTEINCFIHNFDPTLAPQGSTLLTFMLETHNYEYWETLHCENKSQYEIEKKRIAEALIENLDKRFGDIKGSVEMVDVSTPATFKSFSGNWKGSFEGWLLTPETGFRTLPHTLPGLSNFYMCGQWVAIGGGLPGVLNSARETAQIICHQDRMPFQIIKPEHGPPKAEAVT